MTIILTLEENKAFESIRNTDRYKKRYYHEPAGRTGGFNGKHMRHNWYWLSRGGLQEFDVLNKMKT